MLMFLADLTSSSKFLDLLGSIQSLLVVISRIKASPFPAVVSCPRLTPHSSTTLDFSFTYTLFHIAQSNFFLGIHHIHAKHIDLFPRFTEYSFAYRSFNAQSENM